MSAPEYPSFRRAPDGEMLATGPSPIYDMRSGKAEEYDYWRILSMMTPRDFKDWALDEGLIQLKPLIKFRTEYFLDYDGVDLKAMYFGPTNALWKDHIGEVHELAKVHDIHWNSDRTVPELVCVCAYRLMLAIAYNETLNLGTELPTFRQVPSGSKRFKICLHLTVWCLRELKSKQRVSEHIASRLASVKDVQISDFFLEKALQTFPSLPVPSQGGLQKALEFDWKPLPTRGGRGARATGKSSSTHRVHPYPSNSRRVAEIEDPEEDLEPTSVSMDDRTGITADRERIPTPDRNFTAINAGWRKKTDSSSAMEIDDDEAVLGEDDGRDGQGSDADQSSPRGRRPRSPDLGAYSSIAEDEGEAMDLEDESRRPARPKPILRRPKPQPTQFGSSPDLSQAWSDALERFVQHSIGDRIIVDASNEFGKGFKLRESHLREYIKDGRFAPIVIQSWLPLLEQYSAPMQTRGQWILPYEVLTGFSWRSTGNFLEYAKFVINREFFQQRFQDIELIIAPYADSEGTFRILLMEPRFRRVTLFDGLAEECKLLLRPMELLFQSAFGWAQAGTLEQRWTCHQIDYFESMGAANAGKLAALRKLLFGSVTLDDICHEENFTGDIRQIRKEIVADLLTDKIFPQDKDIPVVLQSDPKPILI